MGCLSSMGRLLLVVINIVFLLIGLGLTIVGLILRFGRTIYEPILKIGIDNLQDVIDKTSIGGFKVEDIDIGETLQSIAIGLIVGGLVLVVISFFGCCGACCKSEILLWLYVIVLVVIAIGEAVAIGLLYGKPELVKDNVKTSLKDYEGLGSSRVSDVSWNIIMIQFNCCGVDSYEDFSIATNWKKSLTVGSNTYTLTTPVACCKKLPSSKNSGEFSCATDNPPKKENSNAETGCYSTIWDQSFGNTAIAVPVLVVCGLIQIAFIALAIFIIKSEDKKVSPI